jgi:hypothetical protein
MKVLLPFHASFSCSSVQWWHCVYRNLIVEMTCVIYIFRVSSQVLLNWHSSGLMHHAGL